MLGAALVAAFISGPRPAVRPPGATLTSIPQIVRSGEEGPPLDRLMRDKAWPLAQAGPLVLKADFKHGLAAALSLKF